VLFLRQQSLLFRPLGRLQSQPDGRDDDCRASCVDWYGNCAPDLPRQRGVRAARLRLVEGGWPARRGASASRNAGVSASRAAGGAARAYSPFS
jgi:hypothetical protein